MIVIDREINHTLLDLSSYSFVTQSPSILKNAVREYEDDDLIQCVMTSQSLVGQLICKEEREKSF